MVPYKTEESMDTLYNLPPPNWQTNITFYISPENCETLDTKHLKQAYIHFKGNITIANNIDWVVFLRVKSNEYRDWRQSFGEKV